MNAIASRLLPMLLLLLLAAGGAQAQRGNVLVNPGFEGEFYPAEGYWSHMIALGWIPWYIPPADEDAPSYANVQPEYQMAAVDAEDSTVRVYEGGRSQLLRSWFATMDGGLYQQVGGIEVGTWLRFSVLAWIWSSTLEDESFSADDGDVYIQVGIDPRGGTDGASEDIVWSEITYEYYDDWREYVVVTQAQEREVTVFIRSRVSVPVRNSDIYLDQASLLLDAFNAPADTPRAADSAAASAPLVYVVRTGDSVYDIAERYDTTAGAIAAANNLDERYLIHAGVELVIPVDYVPWTGETFSYTVRPGDTFSTIAEAFGTPVDVLARLNRYANITLLEVGETLLIPGAAP